MDAPGWMGDYDRPHDSVQERCMDCKKALFPGESEKCSVCLHEYYDNLQDEYAADEDMPDREDAA
jgi:hypothetical protein